MTSKLRLMPVILFTTMLTTSCETTQMPALSGSNPIKAVPCTELTVVDYHAPNTVDGIRKWLAGSLPDTQNALDTPSTVSAVRKNNAARSAVCGP